MIHHAYIKVASSGCGRPGPAAKRGVNEFLIVLLSWVIIAAGGAFVLRKAERERETHTERPSKTAGERPNTFSALHNEICSVRGEIHYFRLTTRSDKSDRPSGR